MALLSTTTPQGTTTIGPINLTSREFKANPFEVYARLRADAPVHQLKLPTREKAWFVTRYDDVAMVLKDDRFVKDTANAMTPEQLAKRPWFRKMFRSIQKTMLDSDAPDHPRLRMLVHKAFTPRLIERSFQRIQTLSDELIDKVVHKGQMDLIRDFALPLPMTIISEMLGVPLEDRPKFRKWSNALLAASASPHSLIFAMPQILSLIRYLKKMLKNRRADPKDDLISGLVKAEESGDMLNEDELLSMIVLLLVAGHETTVNLIGNGILALLQHPDQIERLKQDPSLIKPAIEELLRFTCPVEMATERYTREDVTIGNVTIPRGEMVFAVLGSANRDEQQFPNAEVLDITREPNRHLAFGYGAHFCLGAPLARLEGQIAIGTLLRRLPNLRLSVAPNRLTWRRVLLLRGLESLPVAFGK